ncbi:ABC transporter ATP-binding protein [Denitrobacterium detoxificans]|jgi:ABC-type nitrate/sulfonate/bicarbonate transport system ATPase subunit|uniref:ABC transporter ATP-binding protein n=1 Tax=Denitrobacterium detoxificans TaxID=79604 RepID=UPI0026EB024A|nr:ABC transporter ATP-binding protein [Denitrobacterium detoxificans]MBE6465465.1 ABC transporter ATP-binding protein [Denitrobacterium detoxificans]
MAQAIPTPAKQTALPAIEGRNLEIRYDDTTVVAQANLHVNAGEICCLIGKSGCGKTTILNTLAGLVTPTQGSVLSFGEDVTGKPGSIGYMLQKDLLLPHLRIIDNAALPLLLKGQAKQEARETAARLFPTFGLEGTEELWPHQLSGGMRQRVALLRTYVTGARCLLLDEPFSALDAITRADMRFWFTKVTQKLGLSALVITHDVDEAVSLAQRVYVLAGNPRLGQPSTIHAEIHVERNGNPDGPFELTEEFLKAKRSVWAALQENAQ